MGHINQGLLGSAGGGADWRAGENQNYAIAGLVPLFPTFALIAHYIVASERGIEALRATIVFGMPVDSSLFYLSAVTVVFHRDHAPAVGAGRRGGMLGLCAWLLILGWSRFH
ncbi:GlpM family protein [Klebsiella pneumoniae subsp. pneumoniae]|nr:GlpM family protein [Klebsiella pneumoniae subsp. pneumoniae]